MHASAEPAALATIARIDRLAGVLLGTAAGDAVGLPREGLSRRRAARLFGDGPLRHELVLGRGLLSEDSEHTCLSAQALLASGGEPTRFLRSLSLRLRLWLLGLPAGVGLATLRALCRLWIGFSPERSGVRSAGNGPAMRAAILGACSAADEERLRQLVRASTRLTHRDPRAEQGALLIALGARRAALAPAGGLAPEALLEELRAEVEDGELRAAMATAAEHLHRGASAEELADALGLHRGVTGYVVHTVPVAIFCWLRHAPDFRAAVEAVVRLGGDSDTTAAIVGGLMGATVGAAAIPADWIDGIADWPRGVRWMRALAARLARRFPLQGPGEPQAPLPLAWPLLPLRNLLFLGVVLGHGLRRMLPPY